MMNYLKKQYTTYKKRGFTLIELIVVMSVIAVLVLLAAPRFLGQTDKAKMAQIQNDIRAAETKVAEWLATHEDRVEKWEYDHAFEEDATLLNKEADRVDAMAGLESITDYVREETDTRLPGGFFSDKDGLVYYYDAESSISDSSDQNNEPDMSYDEWLASLPEEYEVATDEDFEKVKNENSPKGYFYRYTGENKYVVVPPVIYDEEITDINAMFQMSNVEGIALNNPKVTSMMYTFQLTMSESLDLTYFQTYNVENMSGMFALSQVKRANINHFDTSSVTNMKAMFHSSALTSIDVGNWETNQVTDMEQMFVGLTVDSIDLSRWDISNVVNTDMMFLGVNSNAVYVGTSHDALKVVNSSYFPAELEVIVAQ